MRVRVKERAYLEVGGGGGAVLGGGREVTGFTVVMVVGQILKEKKKGKSPEKKILAEAVIEGTKMTTTDNERRNQWGGCSFHPWSPR